MTKGAGLDFNGRSFTITRARTNSEPCGATARPHEPIFEEAVLSFQC